MGTFDDYGFKQQYVIQYPCVPTVYTRAVLSSSEIIRKYQKSMRDKSAKENLGTQQSGLQISSQELEIALPCTHK